MKLILGTANWGLPYGTSKERLTLNEIERILEFARKNGISILEGSEAYKCDDAVGNKYFDLIYKVQHPYNINRIKERLGRTEFLGLMYHHGFETQSQYLTKHSGVHYTGASIYKAGQLTGHEEMVEVPLNLENRTFEKLTAPCKIVRSVFGRGELLKTHTVKECLDFIKTNPTVHGVIVGVDNVGQLQEIVKAWNE